MKIEIKSTSIEVKESPEIKHFDGKAVASAEDEEDRIERNVIGK